MTYSLREKQINSNQYYNNITVYTKQVVIKAEEFLRPLPETVMEFYSTEGKAAKEFAILDFMILGILWKVYSGNAGRLNEIPGTMLTMLSNLRNNNSKIKPCIDFLKGIMSTIFLSPNRYNNTISIKPSMDNLGRLTTWLKATGEFNQEVKRLERLKDFLMTLPKKDSVNLIASAINFATWFESSSKENIGIYTESVERYLNEVHPKRYWHEDVIFCGRRRVEYHLNMVGAEIMNKALRESFLKTDKKLLLLPGCMRLLPEFKCKAKKGNTSIKCVGCSNGCQVNQLTKMGKENNFKVAVVPHESSIAAAIPDKRIYGKNVGVIGVACVLNLISGGLKLKEMGIPAQCVLLDYSGCKRHWHDEGVPTCINIEKLLTILDKTK